jgi:hypothetical protein
MAISPSRDRLQQFEDDVLDVLADIALEASAGSLA